MQAVLQSISHCLGPRMRLTKDDRVDVLVLGAGWTFGFLEPLLKEAKLSYAATSRDGRNSTIPFQFNDKADAKLFEALPDARTIVIVFPIYGKGGSRKLLELYKETHPDTEAGFIQLGSTGIWDGGPTFQSEEKKGRHSIWYDRHTPFNKDNPRAIAEVELLSLSTEQNPTTVLDLVGLWGGLRSVRHFVPRIASSKEVLATKTALHMVHGTDYSRLILAIHAQWHKAAGQRFMVSDLRVYDMWELVARYGENGVDGEHKNKSGQVLKWVSELMDEHDVKALPRTPEQLGKAYDCREVWSLFGLQPIRGGLD